MNTEQKIKEAIKKGITYNSLTGNIYGISGKLITNKNQDGYIKINILIDGKITCIKGHLFAWYYTYNIMPLNTIDHINRIRDDNSIINLRDVTQLENQQNRTENGLGLYNNRKNWRNSEKGKAYYKNYQKNKRNNA